MEYLISVVVVQPFQLSRASQTCYEELNDWLDLGLSFINYSPAYEKHMTKVGFGSSNEIRAVYIFFKSLVIIVLI